MKKLINLVAFAAMLFAPSLAWSQSADCTEYTSVPYSTGFEGISTGSLPDCWTQIQTGTNNEHTFPSVYEYAPNTHAGSCYFEFESSSSSSDTEIVALPMMQNISSLELSMWISSSSSYACSIEVGVLETGNVFVPVDTLDLITFSGASAWASSYHQYTSYFSTYTGTGERIAIRAVRTGSGQFTLFLDDLSVNEFTGCYPLRNLTLTDADSSSISISWTDNLNNAGNYTVQYCKSGTTDTITENNVSSTSFTATNLDASSEYNFLVYAQCSNGSSNPISGSFRTTCGEATLPFSEGFESSDALSCWTMVDCQSATGYNSGDANTGNACFRFRYGYNPQYLISPRLAVTGNSAVVEFSYKRASYNETFHVGYSTTTNDTSAFIWGQEISDATTSYQDYMMVVPAGTKYVAIKYTTYDAYYLYIDDLAIHEDNGCNKPNMAIVDSVGPYTAWLRWTNGGDNTSSYDLLYGTSNDMTAATVINSLTDTSYTLTDLLPQTTYYAWVRTACGSDITDARPFGSFTTQLTCAAVTNLTVANVSFTAGQITWAYDTTQGFPTQGVEITLVNNNDTTAEPIVEIVTGNSYTFSNLSPSSSYTVTLRNLCQASSADPDTASAATTTFMTSSCSEIGGGTSSRDDMPLDGYYNYSFSQTIYTNNEMPDIDTINGIAYKVVSGGNVTRTIDVYMGHTTESTLSGNSIPVAGMTHVVTNGNYATGSNDWSQIMFDSVFVYNGTDNLVVTIVDHTGSYEYSRPYFQVHSTQNQTVNAYTDGSPYDPTTAVSATTRNYSPDIQFMANCEVPQCFAPMLSLDQADSNQITVSWESVGTESEWAVGTKADGATSITWNTGSVYDLSYTFTDLNPNTLYTIYVGSLCSNDTLIASLNARTLCGALNLPYTESFETSTINGTPNCWNIVHDYLYNTYDYSTWENIQVTVPYISDNAHTGNNAMRLRSDNSPVLVTTSAIPANGQALAVSFWAEASSYYSFTLEAGLMTDLTVDSTFHPAVTINSEMNYTQYEFTTRELSSDTTYYLAFRFNGAYDYDYADIDDIEIRVDDGCHRSTNVAAYGTDTASVLVTWDNDGNVEQYAIKYRLRGTETWSAPEFPYDNSYTVENLSTSTAYEFIVGTICSSDTLWTLPVIARTNCAPMTVPYTNSFENDATGEMAACWSNIGATGTSYWGDTYPAVTNDHAHTGNNAIRFEEINGTSIVISDAVPLVGDSIYVSFWSAVVQGYSGTVSLEAGVMTNVLADSTFIPLLTLTGASDYALHEFNTSSLTAYHDSTLHIAFRYSTTDNYSSADIDDINIRLDEGCMYPTNLVATPGADDALLEWNTNGTTGTYAIEYRTVGDVWSTASTTTDTTYTITGLTPATAYEARVGFLCGTDTLWTNTSFQTNCTLLPVPYAEDFDAYAEDVMPPCWGWSSVSATHFDGGVFFRSYHGGGSEYVVVPELDGAISKLKIEFDAKVGTIAENDGILIGVADAGGTLLAWLDTIQDANFSRNAHVRKTVYFTNYNMPSGAARVAFAQYRNWNEWALIDNINIEVLPDCYPVDNLVGHNLDDIENTTFTWTPQGYADEWQVYVDTVTVDLDSLATLPDSLFTTVSTPSYTLPIGSVQGGGIYNFFVRSHCSATENSGWVKNEFGAGTIIMDQTTDTVTGCGFVVYDNGGPIAGYLGNTNAELVLRTENAGSQLQIFGGKFGFGMDAATLTVYDGEGTTGDVLYTYNTVNGRDTLLNTVLATSTTGSLTITFVVNGTMCHTGYELYIRCTDGAICPRPTELQAEMTSETTATATWTGTASNYNFYYRIGGSTTWVRQNVSTNSVNLTGLVADTVYDMYVVALCSATDSSTASVTRQLSTYRSTPELQVFTVTVNSADATMGTATADHTGEVQENTVVTATATANNGYHFVNWSSNGTVVSTDNPYTFTLTANITLTANFESDSSSHEGIDDIANAAIALYPNPATTTVTISGISGQATVSIVDMNGRVSGEWKAESGKLTIDLAGYAQGAYFVRITGEQINAIRKLIVK